MQFRKDPLITYPHSWLKQLNVPIQRKMAHVAAQPRPRVRPRTWRFDLTLQSPAFSSAEAVRLVFLAIRDHATPSGGEAFPTFPTLTPRARRGGVSGPTGEVPKRLVGPPHTVRDCRQAAPCRAERRRRPQRGRNFRADTPSG